MNPIPVYDATTPITCTIGADEVAGRIELLERLRASHAGRRGTEHGMELTFPSRPDVAADVRRLADEERRCCGFWGFDITAELDTIVLRWEAPPDASAIITRLGAYFDGDASLDAALAGLL
jgi:hypothetical protein